MEVFIHSIDTDYIYESCSNGSMSPIERIDVVEHFCYGNTLRGKMEEILLAYGIPKETVAAITILYKNTKVKVRSIHRGKMEEILLAYGIPKETVAAIMIL